MSESVTWLDRFAAKGMHPVGYVGAGTVAEQAAMPDPSTEKGFMAEVIRIAKLAGWKVYHTHNSRKSEAGFPDLILLRERLIAAELKTADGVLTAAQANWLEAFHDAGIDARTWRPSDWKEIESVLTETPNPKG